MENDYGMKWIEVPGTVGKYLVAEYKGKLLLYNAWTQKARKYSESYTLSVFGCNKTFSQRQLKEWCGL